MFDHSTGRSIKSRTREFSGSIARLGLSVPSNSTVDLRLKAAERYGAHKQAVYSPDLYLVGEFLQLANSLEALEARVNIRRHWRRLVQSKDFYPKFLEIVIAGRLARFEKSVEDAEPDIRLIVQGKPLSIACKYLTSLPRILKVVREARKQIARQSAPGFILLEVSEVIGMDDAEFSLDEEAWWSTAESRCIAMLRPFGAELERSLAGSLVRSVVCRLTRTLPVMKDGEVILSTLDSYLNLRMAPDPRVAEVLELLKRAGG